MSFEAEIDELRQRGDAVALAKRWLARAVESGDPAACGAAMRAVAGRRDDEARIVTGEAAVWLGEHHLARGAYPAAAEAFERASEAYRGLAGATSRFAEAVNKLGRVRFKLGRYDAALAAAEEGLGVPDAAASVRARMHVDRGNALLVLERADEARVAHERALAVAGDDTAPASRHAVALAHQGLANVASTAGDAAAARASLAIALDTLAGLPQEHDIVRSRATGHFILALIELGQERPDDALRELARSLELVATMPAGPVATGDLGHLRMYRAFARLMRHEYRAAYVELAGALPLLEQAAAATGSQSLRDALVALQVSPAGLSKLVLELEKHKRPPDTARCAFCGGSPLTSRRRMIGGIGAAVICSGCYPRALADVDARSPRDARTKVRAGTPRFRKGVTCDFCGEGYRRQFILGDEHKICDECLDACADIR